MVSSLIDLDALAELLVFVADELDRFLVEEALVDADGERFVIGLRVGEGNVDFQLAERRTTESLDEFGVFAVRAAADIEPSIGGTVFGAPQVVCFNNKS